MGARCQSIKESWTRQIDCHSDLLLNPRRLTLFCLLWKSNIHKHTEQSGTGSFPPVEAVTAEERWLLGTTLEGQHLPKFSKLSCGVVGEAEGNRKERKKMNPYHPHPQKHLLCNDCYFFKIAFSPTGSLASPFSKDEE